MSSPSDNRDALEDALAELGAQPYHPMFAPLTPEQLAANAEEEARLQEEYQVKIDALRKMTDEEIRAEIKLRTERLGYLYENHDLWERTVGDEYHDLEDRLGQLESEMLYRHGGEVRDDEPSPPRATEAHSEYVKSLQQQLWRARSNYRSALMSNPTKPGWDRMCSNLEDEVHDLERELADHLAERPLTPPPAAPVLLMPEPAQK